MGNTKEVPGTKFKKKGGTVFPRITLEDAVSYAQKLVTKTFNGPQPASIVFPGVFGAKGNRGEIRASAMKQYGLMGGTASAYLATQLSKDLVVVSADSRSRALRDACLRPKVFRVLFDTFHGDTATISELKRQAQSTNVHPELLDACIDVFCSSLLFAGLGTRQGDQVVFASAVDDQPSSEEEADEDKRRDRDLGEVGKEARAEASPEQTRRPSQPEREGGANGTPSARAVIHVNVNLDSSLDTEKLERQLALLRRYGAI